MKPVSLLQDLGIALVLTGLAAVNEGLLRLFINVPLSIKINFSISILIYLSYLIWQSQVAAGKIIMFITHLAIIVTCLLLAINLNILIFIYTSVICLNRWILNYASMLARLADTGLCLISMSAAYWVLLNGHSIITVLWCLLLLQALHTLIPQKKLSIKQQAEFSGDDFDRALQTAENALQQLLKTT